MYEYDVSTKSIHAACSQNVLFRFILLLEGSNFKDLKLVIIANSVNLEIFIFNFIHFYT
jgi:hypothetical protein